MVGALWVDVVGRSMNVDWMAFERYIPSSSYNLALDLSRSLPLSGVCNPFRFRYFWCWRLVLANYR